MLSILHLIVSCLVVSSVLGASSPVWAYDTNFKCGTVIVVNSNSGGNRNYTVNYPAAYTGSNPHVSLGIAGLAPNDQLATSLNFLFNIGTQNVSAFTMQLYLTSGNFSLISLSYFSKASTYSFVFVSYQELVPTVINTGTGNRSEDKYPAFSSGATIDMTHSYYVMPFLTGINMNKGASSNFHLEVITKVFNSTNYQCTYRTSGSTSVSWVAYYSITFDQTVVQQTQNRFFDTVFMVGTNGLQGAYSLVAFNTTNFVSGLNTFNFTNTNGLNFNFSTTNFALSCNTTYAFINISTWNHRIRTCNSPDIYYVQDQNLCYSSCPAGYFVNATYNFCTACHYSCATCSAAASTNCITCGTTRTITSGSCPCNAGYYDVGTATCSACGVTCATCTNSTTCATCVSTGMTLGASGCTCTNTASFFNTTSKTCQACGTGCAVCTSSTSCTTCVNTTAMTISGGTCSCNQTSYYFNSTANNCVACGSLCQTCTSSTSCSACTGGNMVVSGGTCVCAIQYYLSGTTCVSCAPLCQTCSQANICQTCISAALIPAPTYSCVCLSASSYYNNATSSCVACGSYCQNCTNSTSCQTCTYSSMSISGGNCTCPAGKFINTTSTLCESCGTACSSCNSSACLTCYDNTMTITGTTCTCSSTSQYYNSTSNTCVACGTNCSACTSSTACTTCVNPSLTISGGTCVCASGTCSVCGTGCQTCVSASNCTTCVASGMMVTGGTCSCAISNYYFNSSECVKCPLGCMSCASSNLCTLCSSLDQKINGAGLCTCNITSNYYNQSNGSCLPCPSGCSTCSNSTLCLTCTDATMTIVSGLCICPSGKYLNTSSCANCQSTCKTCSSSSTCDTCDPTKNLTYNSNSKACVCVSGYTLSGSACVQVTNTTSCSAGYTKSGSNCVEVCGDGKLYELACDDGNSEDGDGCDQNCNVESGYACKDGSPTSPSICSYNGSLTLTLTKAIKNTYSNSIMFFITVSPKVKVLSQVDVNQTLSTNLPISSIDSNYSNGQLIVLIFYNQSIQNTQATVNMTPPNASNAWAMQKSCTVFVVQPDNNQPAVYNDEAVYTFASVIFNIIRITAYTAIGLTLVGVLFGKLIVLEMVTAVQASMMGLVLIKDWHPFLGPVASYVRYVNGYNELFVHFPTLMSFTHPKTTQTIYGVGYQAQFLYNVNYDLMIAVALIAIGGLLLATNLCKSGHRTSCMQKLAGFIGRELGLSLVIFTSFNYAFSTCVTAIFDRDTSEFLIGMIAAGLAQLPLIFVIVLFCMNQDAYNDVKTWLKPDDRICRLHPLIVFVQRTILGVLFGVSSFLPTVITIVLPSFQFCYLLYYLIKRPFLQTYITVRGVFNELILLLALLIPLYYDKLTSLIDFGSHTQIIPLTLLGCVILLVVIALLNLTVWGLQRACSGKDSKNAIHPVDSGSERGKAKDDSERDSKEEEDLRVVELDQSREDLGNLNYSKANRNQRRRVRDNSR